MIPLPQIHIPTPCHQSWDAMMGDAQVRFCAGCRKLVYNVSEMTREEARSVLDRAEDHVCVRFFSGADGQPLTREDQLPAVPADVLGFRTGGPRRLAAAVSWVVAVMTAGLGFGQAAVAAKAPHAARPANRQTKSPHRYRLGQFFVVKPKGATTPRPSVPARSGFDLGAASMGGLRAGPPPATPPAALGEIAVPVPPRSSVKP